MELLQTREEPRRATAEVEDRFWLIRLWDADRRNPDERSYSAAGLALGAAQAAPAIAVAADLVIGRDPRSDVCVSHDVHASTRHARLRLSDDGALVEDLESKNGTFLNGERLARGERRPTRHGDVLKAGRGSYVLWRSPVEPDLGVLRLHGWVGVRCANAAAAEALEQRGDGNVLLVGESGTGKERLARALHASSPRAARPFVAHCSAIGVETLIEPLFFGAEKGAWTGAQPQTGLLAQANRGTFFLDEIADMPQAAQAKLLRALDDNKEFFPVGSSEPRKVEFRVISATSQPIEAHVRNGRFRRDLFFRLTSSGRSIVRLAPLRERRLDIAVLAAAFLSEKFGADWRVDDESVHHLLTGTWMGNTRELRRACFEAERGADGLLRIPPCSRVLDECESL